MLCSFGQNNANKSELIKQNHLHLQTPEMSSVVDPGELILNKKYFAKLGN